MGQSRHNNIKTNNRLSGCHPDINYQSVELTLFHISPPPPPPPPLLGVWTDCYTIKRRCLIYSPISLIFLLKLLLTVVKYISPESLALTLARNQNML